MHFIHMNGTNGTDDANELVLALLHAVHDYVPSQAQFIILLMIVPFALACNVFVLYRLLTKKVLRKELHNHVIIAILFASLQFNLIHVPFSINLFRTGSIWPRSIIACSIWRFTAYTGCNANDVLLAWAAVERHILIYHDNMMRLARNRWIFHYGPLVLLTIYLLAFNGACFFTPACFSHYDFSLVFCDASCLNSVPFMSAWYLMVNQLTAATLAIVFSLILWIRIVQRRKRMRGTVEWRRLNKLTAQVLVITVLFIFLEMPYAITCCLTYGGYFTGSTVFGYANSISLFLCYIMPIVMPFACFLGLFQDMWPKRSRVVQNLSETNQNKTCIKTNISKAVKRQTMSKLKDAHMTAQIDPEN